MTYTSISKIESYAKEFDGFCAQDMFVKTAIIKKLPNGYWTVMSLKGKRLGKYKTKEEAVKRLRQIEYFKHHKKKASKDDSYSSVMRELNKSDDKDAVKNFQAQFKKSFDQALLDGAEDPEKEALNTAIKDLDTTADYRSLDLKKIGNAIDLGDPEAAGKYLSDLIKFLLRRISANKRQKSIENLRRKIYYLNEYQMASRRTPASSSIGQSITLLKTILLEHSAEYIRIVLNSVVKNL